MKTRRQFISVAASGGGLAALGLLGWLNHKKASGLEVVRATSRALGTNVTMVALHESRAAAERAISAAFDELELVEEIMSLYRPHSQLSRLNRERALEDPHPYLVWVLQRAQQMSLESGGAFDVTVQPLWDVYAAAQRQGRLPDDRAIESARARVNYRKLELTPKRLRLHGDGMGITLNGIAQGFAADRALAALRAHGVENALVDTGELGAFGCKERGEPWTVGVQHPRRAESFVSVAKLDGRCMATSGDYETAFTQDRSCNHIFDPATGRSPHAFSSVTVLAPTGVDADALSTAVFVLGFAKGLRLIKQWPGADALFVLKNEAVISTAGFPRSPMSA